MIVVTGKLHLYGIAPEVVSTKLIETAHVGDNEIIVKQSTGWEVGD